MNRSIAPTCLCLMLIAGCGGTTDTATSDEPYSGSCGLGTAAYALESGSSSETSPSFTITGETDVSAFCAQNSGTSITLVTPTIASSAISSSESDATLHGLSAAVLAYGSSTTSASGGAITMSGGDITTTSDYANAAFATGLGANLTLHKVEISTSGDHAHAVVATRAGSATISGTASTPASLTSAAAEVVVVEGASSVSISNADLLSSNTNDHRGIYIYDSESASGTAKLDISGGSYVWSSSDSDAAAIYVENQTAVITLEEVAITQPASSALLKAVAGSLGSDVTLKASSQALSGNITADASSTIKVSLASASSLSGAVNSSQTANAITVTLDASSTWTLTADSYVTVLNDSAGINGSTVSNIIGNGYNLYYRSSNNATLAGATYALTGGGSLLPY